MKKLPTGIPSFKKIRDGNYLYIDKTKQILKLTESGDSFFLSRPRRFGKSLLLDTLDALFRGEKELFKGLYIYDKWDWQIKYPVIRLDMSGDALTSKILINTLFDGVNLSAFSEKIDLKSNTAAGQFAELIIKLEEKYKQKVVILIDEYDKPILDHLDAMKDTKTSIGNKKVLSSFYSTMKTYNGHLHFAFLTGVTRLSGLSVFSGLNNITNLTLNDKFCDICGYTQKELEENFDEYIKRLAKSEKSTFKKTLADIKEWYDGYTWDGKTSVYNPYSTLMLFDSLEFGNYWSNTGSPSFLVDYFKRNDVSKNIIFESKKVTAQTLEEYGGSEYSEYTLLFQAGYLTIDKKTKAGKVIKYELCCPNLEVEYSYAFYVLSGTLNIDNYNTLTKLHNKIQNAMFNLDNERLADIFSYAFSIIPNEIIRREKIGGTEFLYHTSLLLFLVGNTFKVNAGESTRVGRSDIVIECEKETFVIAELKYINDAGKANERAEKSLDKALTQIENKKYCDKYKHREDCKRIIMLAIVFVDKGAKIFCKLKDFWRRNK